MHNHKTNGSLNCPMPELDFDIITLGHGSGGELTHRLLENGVFNLLDNQWLEERHDGSLLELRGKTAFSTDTFVVSPIFFPGGNIGDLAINGTVNDLAMCGAVPKYLSLSFIIEEGLKTKDLWEILLSIKKAAEDANVTIVTGDTKVVERGKGDQLFINTTGIGVVHDQSAISFKRVMPGDKVIISGNVANHGMAIMSVREGLEFETEICSDTTNLNHTVIHLLDEFGLGVKLMRDPTRGGVATVLNEIAGQTNFGIDIHEKNIPVEEEVSAACELLGLDPLYVANEGIFISIVSNDIADAYLDKLRSLSKGTNARCIGEVVTDHPGKVVLSSAIGGRRVVNMLPGEQLPRIC